MYSIFGIWFAMW